MNASQAIRLYEAIELKLAEFRAEDKRATNRVRAKLNNFNQSLFMGRLRLARERQGLSQKEVATRTKKLHAAAISHFEQGSRTPHMGNLFQLCRALNVSADWLLGLVNEPDSEPAAPPSTDP